MIVNPILYMLSMRSVHGIVANCLSQFTRKERSIVEIVRLRFGCINLAFYVCWLPNIINGILTWAFWYNLPNNILLIVWYIMVRLK
jgi:ocular albinism type 1 protein